MALIVKKWWQHPQVPPPRIGRRSAKRTNPPGSVIAAPVLLCAKCSLVCEAHPRHAVQGAEVELLRVILVAAVGALLYHPAGAALGLDDGGVGLGFV